MSPSPVISVLMPVYNCKEFVQEAVDSILNQTYTDFELLLIDDVSTDGTYELLLQLTDPRIKLLRKQKNSGYTDSLNMGLAMAKGELIARMDGDDSSHPDRFQQQVHFLNENPQIAICGTWFQLLPTKRIIKHPQENEKIKIALLNYCAIGHPTVMFRKRFFESNQLTYNKEFEPAEDYDLWTRAVKFGTLGNVPQVLLQYRMHTSQVSSSKAAAQMYHSAVCKQRMLYYIFDEPSVQDKAMSEMLFKEEVTNEAALDMLLSWLDLLPEINRRRLVFADDSFRQYIEATKQSVLIKFYFYHKAYNLKTLYRYSISSLGSTLPLPKKEKIKFIAKCLVHWKTKT